MHCQVLESIQVLGWAFKIIKAWLATYFDLPHSQLRNTQTSCNGSHARTTWFFDGGNSKPELYYIEVPNL